MLTLSLFKNYLFSSRAGALIRIISWICVVGVSVGVSSLILVMSVMNGFNDSIRSKMLVTKPHLIISDSDATVKEWSARIGSSSLESIYRVTKQDVVIKTLDGVFGGAVANGMEVEPLKDFFRRLSDKENGGEASFQYIEDAAELNESEVILGLGLAKNLNVFEGDTVIIIPPESLLLPAGEIPFYSRAKVKVILQTELQDVDNQSLYYNSKLGLKKLSRSSSRFSEVQVRLNNLDDLMSVKEKIASFGAEVDTWQDRDRAMLFALKMEKLIIGTFIGLSTIITAFSILTVLILLITQKRRDIGVLMAMGLSLKNTKWLFVRIGLILSFLGLGSGLVIGLGLSLSLDQARLDLLPNIYYDTAIPISVEPSLILIALIGGGVIAFIGSYLPANLTIKKTPSEALRAKL